LSHHLFSRFNVQDKISGFEDELKFADEAIEKENVTVREAYENLDKVDNIEMELNYKRNDLETQLAVIDKQKELLGKDDLTEKHSYQDLMAMLRELDGQRHGNEATKLLDAKVNEYNEIEHEIVALRKNTNELNSMKGKLEAERDAHTR
jgi:hypothetical protein